jgi:Flp pilus assembly pilin Flp
MTFIKNFLKDEDGASAVEYAILVALIAAAVFTAVQVFDFNSIFTSANNKVQNKI